MLTSYPQPPAAGYKSGSKSVPCVLLIHHRTLLIVCVPEHASFLPFFIFYIGKRMRLEYRQVSYLFCDPLHFLHASNVEDLNQKAALLHVDASKRRRYTRSYRPRWDGKKTSRAIGLATPLIYTLHHKYTLTVNTHYTVNAHYTVNTRCTFNTR